MHVMTETPPNMALQRTCRNVPLAFASAAPVRQSAELGC
jgi:hypothetical protein